MSNSKQRPYEQENYPASPEIIYYGDQKFSYTVIQEEGNPHYLICFGNNFQHQIVLVQSIFDAFIELHNIIISNKKTAVSGVHLYRLQLKCIDRNRKSKLWALKLHDESSKTTQIRHAKGLAKCVQINFKNSIQDYYNPKDRVVLKTLEFTVQNKDYYITFGEKNPNKQNQKLQSVEYAVSQTHQKIDVHIEQLIPINFVDLTPTIISNFSEESDITDLIIVEQVNSAISKDAYQSIKKILKYIIPAYIQNEKLDPTSPIIHLRISGDGCNVKRKCEITKNQCEDRQTEWIISKKMSVF
ncbi:hypothetical protein RhiirB3_392656 [Rhizophagus irregularis]|nr:hypothetical protein RhiirB3_392656 [Rhizophagus irregularis]